MLPPQQVSGDFGSFPWLTCSQIQTIRATVHSLLERCDASYKITPYDHDLHQECIDEAVRRGYPVESDPSVLTFLPVGVVFAATAGRHHARATQIWIALYTSSVTYVDEIPSRFPLEISNVYLFNDRFLSGQQQGNAILDALADIIRQTPDLYQPIPSGLFITASLNFITANLLEHETKSMQVWSLRSVLVRAHLT